MVITKSNIAYQKSKIRSRNIKVKICGITNLDDAVYCVKSGADALGFVFYKKSKRYISPEDARSIINRLPHNVIKVGVFVDEKQKAIRKIARLCKLDFIQLHGSQTPAFCNRLGRYKIIKAFRIKKDIKNIPLEKYAVVAYLFDTFDRHLSGGTGKAFEWGLLSRIERHGQFILSGGLNIANIKKAIKIVRPDWVDVSSSLEKTPGIKDHLKVKKFIRLAKE